jgi:hypothetical protein
MIGVWRRLEVAMRWLVALVLALMMVVVAMGHVPAAATVSGEDGLIAFVSDRSGVSQVCRNPSS